MSSSGGGRVDAGVSIVMPVHGRASLTRRCLDALLPGLPGECELIVVDDASPDATQTVLASYGERVRVLALPDNVGYARACNAGAAIAAHETLVFLNNDTEPLPGWLGALVGYARAHPAAAVVGAKLLYPTGSVQHAGVAIGQDGYPHNLYAGLPGDHHAVNRSRRLQAVTGACMLVRRAAFERAGCFDPAYLNSLEDVDLCLRIGQAGGEVHYCHEAVLVHLESASRGREQRFQRSVERYRERWRQIVCRDDLAIYAEDGLLEVEYLDSHPLHLTVSPHLASVYAGEESRMQMLLAGYAGHVRDLLAEVVRLTALVGDHPLGAPCAGRSIAPVSGLDHERFLAEASRIEADVHALQRRIEDAALAVVPEGVPELAASRRLGYRREVQLVRAAVAETVPPGANVLVVSRGDRELLAFEGRAGQHFPQDASGRYLGHHPRDSGEAIARLEERRRAGADYLVLPQTASWWLEYYHDFAAHLRRRYAVSEHDVCSIYRLRPAKRRGGARLAGRRPRAPLARGEVGA